MKFNAKYFAMLLVTGVFSVIWGSARANVNQDFYSDSLNRQLNMAEVPKSFESSASSATTIAMNDTSDSNIDSMAAIESVEELDQPVQKISKKKSKRSRR